MGFCLFALFFFFESGFHSNQGWPCTPESPGFTSQMLDYRRVLLCLADSMFSKPRLKCGGSLSLNCIVGGKHELILKQENRSL